MKLSIVGRAFATGSRRTTTFNDWIRPPHNVWAHVAVMLPLAISQILQRLYHIIDNRYINHLGGDALLVHNIQYNFIILGQAIGVATATSCLIFWRRKEASGRQGSVLLRHLAFSMAVVLFFAAVFFPMSGQIINHFAIPARMSLWHRLTSYSGSSIWSCRPSTEALMEC